MILGDNRYRIANFAGVRSDAAVEQMVSFPYLEIVSAHGPRVTDHSLTYLARLKDLKHVSLTATNVSYEGLEKLTALPKLELLDLDETNLDDDGMLAIEALKHVKRLNLRGTRVSAGAVTRFKLRNPNCEVDTGPAD